MRRRHTYIAVHSDDLRITPHAARFDWISELFIYIVDRGTKSDDTCWVVIRGLSELRERIDNSVCGRNEPVDPPSMEKPSEDGCWILSPVAVHAKDRSSFKRKVSRVEVAVK